MNVTTQHDNATSDSPTNPPTMAGETGLQLRDRRGDKPRNIERRWKRHFGEPFSVFETYDSDTVAMYEALYPVGGKIDVAEKITKRTSRYEAQAGKTVEPNEVPPILARTKWQYACLLFAFIAPTVASVSTTFMVSHAMSGNSVTSLAITAVASSTSLMFLWAGVKNIGGYFVVLATLGFEAFCNAASVFKWLMASMAYSLTTVSGKPSEFLDMVAHFTGRDHQDCATWMAVFTAVMICGAQVSALYELKK